MQDIMQFAGNHTILALAWVILLVLVIVTTVNGMFSKVKVISRGEATRLINKEEAVVVDVRGRDDYRKGHISTAINMLAADIKKGSFGELEKYKAQPLIVVCATGTSASDSAAQLNAAGYEQVYVLKEGVSGWSGDNLPLVSSR
ncbi:rhodanese-like domain-containing protein [Candidatus Erwinia dacicola]|uniref:Rhodanese-like domain protein n=1 Tax=Candidatus Erwinia dacicola TaxID=252393 RepID=A0A1E7Z0F8_9GAMM|nr:rhodanese-like domain-containing protein [Candidatus Erwinia dacicola]NJD00165.1 rhodanese-like domain-containing protein [Candidatus Erwinia dacicola]NJD84727.1 rhodanese-like domain-containing protein [Candidatus Erwinia dacicola]OFC62078.1 rhodanese-like domain-containing protein [Candidatus Erwinia dacicola]RAP71777.1 rhodanese-like domain protein [Candidatus Erwinia dacicola]